MRTQDDLGYSNVGFTALAHNDEPLTPHIDGLANSGVLLNRFYTYRFCSPTRSSFISGRLPIHVRIRNQFPPFWRVFPRFFVVGSMLPSRRGLSLTSQTKEFSVLTRLLSGWC